MGGGAINTKGPKNEAGERGGVLEEGQQAPPRQLRELGEAV